MEEKVVWTREDENCFVSSSTFHSYGSRLTNIDVFLLQKNGEDPTSPNSDTVTRVFRLF